MPETAHLSPRLPNFAGQLVTPDGPQVKCSGLPQNLMPAYLRATRRLARPCPGENKDDTAIPAPALCMRETPPEPHFAKVQLRLSVDQLVAHVPPPLHLAHALLNDHSVVRGGPWPVCALSKELRVHPPAEDTAAWSYNRHAAHRPPAQLLVTGNLPVPAEGSRW